MSSTEESYYINLEKLYVHDVYENISAQYDSFFKQTQINNNITNISKYKQTDETKLTQEKNNKYKAWPKVSKFLLSLDPDCLVADVGCGEGKYLNINSGIATIGSDHSSSLCQLASAQIPSNNSVINTNQVLICDNLSLPFR